MPQGAGIGGCLPALRIMDVESNEFTGGMPKWFAQLDESRLAGNSFNYPDRDQNPEKRELLDLIIQGCEVPSVLCSGLPPESCLAFGENFVTLTTNQYVCHKCEGTVAYTFALMGGLFVLFCLGMAGYVMLIRKFKNMRLWVSTSSIFIYHTSIIAMLGRLTLTWPPSVSFFTSTFTIEFIGFNFARPECLLIDLGVSAFFAYTIFRICILLLLLLGTSAISVGLRLFKRARGDVVDHKDGRVSDKKVAIE